MTPGVNIIQLRKSVSRKKLVHFIKKYKFVHSIIRSSFLRETFLRSFITLTTPGVSWRTFEILQILRLDATPTRPGVNAIKLLRSKMRILAL